MGNIILKHTFFVILLVCSCQKEVEITKEEVHFRSGIAHLTLLKIESDDSLNYPSIPVIKEKVELVMNHEDLQYHFSSDHYTIKSNGRYFQLIENVSFVKENKYYSWVKGEGENLIQYTICPMEIEGNYWYMLTNFEMYESPAFVQFYLNKKREVRNKEDGYIVRSPI